MALTTQHVAQPVVIRAIHKLKKTNPKPSHRRSKAKPSQDLGLAQAAAVGVRSQPARARKPTAKAKAAEESKDLGQD
jgi:hypothetical protein